MDVMDCSYTKEGMFELTNQKCKLTNYNLINPRCYIKFTGGDIEVLDNFNSSESPMNYIFEGCNVYFNNITIHLDDDIIDSLLRMLSANNIKCNNLKIWCKNLNNLTEERLRIIMKIGTSNKMAIIGDKVARYNVTKLFGILQKFCDVIYCFNLNFPRKYTLNSSKLVLQNCSGNLDGVKGLINVNGEKTPFLDVCNDATIYSEDFDELNIYCENRFNIFLKNPSEFRKVKYSGLINRTNCNVVNKYKKKNYKFKIFVNVDFTINNFIQEFFNCKFYNCFFNENQMVMNSYLNHCYFVDGKDNIIDSQII